MAENAAIRATADFKEGLRLISRKAPAGLDGPLMGEFSETTVRVRYAETDQMGVVYHANFYVWFEVGRVEFLRDAGINYKEMETKDDCFIVVAESSCRYRKPARYDEVIRVRTRIAKGNSRMCRHGI